MKSVEKRRNYHVDESQAKSLFTNFLLTNSAMSKKKHKINENNFEIYSITYQEGIVYTIQTVFKKEFSSDVYLPVNEVPTPKTKHVSKSISYPIEYFTFKQPSSEKINCTNCNQIKDKEDPCPACRFTDKCYDCEYKATIYEKCDKCIEKFHYAEQRRCENCSNTSNQVCHVCQGSGSLRHHIKVSVLEDTLRDVWVKCSEDSIPVKVLTSCKGNLIVNETSKHLTAITSFPDAEVMAVSNEYLTRHAKQMRNSLNIEKLYQNQQLVVIPISLCLSKLNKKFLRFFVIGENHVVFMPKKDNSHCTVT